MKPAITIIDAVNDANLFGRWFKDRRTWEPAFALLAALFALPMTREQLALYRQCTGRIKPPTAPAREGWLICGRRSGKSFILAVIAVYLAAFRDYKPLLQPGERGTVLVIATDRKQARVIFRYIRGLLRGVRFLDHLIERESGDSFDLSNDVSIEIATSSYRSTRGYTLVAALSDEVAFWPTTEESTQPDFEVLDAMRPGLATIPGAMLLCASSPYAKRGALFDAWKKHFGKDGPVLVWRAATRTMNPTVPQSIIDDAMERDPASAASEWNAEFRSDISSYIAREAVEACVVPSCFERAPISGTNYFGFVDPSGGSADSFTLAISHREADRGVLDCLREVRPPFSPDQTVEQFAELLTSYNIRKISGDRYAGEWPREAFRKHGIHYEVSERTKSQIYQSALPLLNSARVELLDHPRLVSQLCSLERRTARGGKDSIDHSPGAHDDVANAAAGALVLAAGAVSKAEIFARLGRQNFGAAHPALLPQSAILYATSRRFGF